jgi:hypothetical protein
MYYNKLLLCSRGWMQVDDRRDDALTPRSYPATKTSIQTPTLRVCAWTPRLCISAYLCFCLSDYRVEFRWISVAVRATWEGVIVDCGYAAKCCV